MELSSNFQKIIWKIQGIIMGCDTLTPKDIRLSNIQQITDSIIFNIFSYDSV